MKKTLSILLSICLITLSMGAFALAADDASTFHNAGDDAVSFHDAAEGEKVFTNAAEVLDYVMVGKDFTTPIRIAPAKLTVDGETRDVYFIAMLGMKGVSGQVNSSAGGGTGKYAELVKQVAAQIIPEGAAVILAGHSLGGMTAQELRRDSGFTEKYELINVLCGGSPLMSEKGEAEGTLNRLTDIFDVIPYIRSLTLWSFIRQIKTAHRENGGYFLNPDGAHNLSYARSDVWGKYDALGFPGGDAVISFSEATVQSFGDAA